MCCKEHYLFTNHFLFFYKHEIKEKEGGKKTFGLRNTNVGSFYLCAERKEHSATNKNVLK